LIGKDTRLLVLAPHVDDELNCGGTIARVTATGGQCLIVACAPCHIAVRPEDKLAGKDIVAEFRRSCGILRAEHVLWDYPLRRLDENRQAILDGFVGWAKDFQPTLVLCPSATDLHQDHGQVYAEAMRSVRNAPKLLGWESPNNQREARIDSFVELRPSDLEDKVRAWKCYETQLHRDYFNEDMLRQMAGMRGKQCRCETRLAEGFQHLSEIL
jgi:LmbE family N-acetylglucosaminyl deacetylase